MFPTGSPDEMKKGKSQEERRAQAELRKAEKWWAGLSDGEKCAVHLVERLSTRRVVDLRGGPFGPGHGLRGAD